MARRRRSSSGTKRWLISGILRFFGVSSPAVLIMALLSYMGFKTPVPDSPAESPDAVAQRAKKIIETVSSAKTKLKETISTFASKNDDAPAVAKRATEEDQDLMSVTYQELFDDSPPRAAESKRFTPPEAIPLERPPAKVSDRDRKKSRGDFPDVNPSPYR